MSYNSLSGPSQAVGAIMGLTFATRTQKGSAQGAQEPGHPAAASQAIQVSGQTDQLHLQSGCVEKVTYEPYYLMCEF